MRKISLLLLVLLTSYCVLGGGAEPPCYFDCDCRDGACISGVCRASMKGDDAGAALACAFAGAITNPAGGFARSIDLRGSRLLVGAPDDYTAMGQSKPGRAFVYQLDSSLTAPAAELTWTQAPQSGSMLGAAVALSADTRTAWVAAPVDMLQGGAVYAYDLSNLASIPAETLTQVASNSRAGTAMRSDGATLMVYRKVQAQPLNFFRPGLNTMPAYQNVLTDVNVTPVLAIAGAAAAISTDTDIWLLGDPVYNLATGLGASLMDTGYSAAPRPAQIAMISTGELVVEAVRGGATVLLKRVSSMGSMGSMSFGWQALFEAGGDIVALAADSSRIIVRTEASAWVLSSDGAQRAELQPTGGFGASRGSVAAIASPWAVVAEPDKNRVLVFKCS